MTTLPGLTADEHRDLIVSVGTHRGSRRLSPLEVAQSFARAREAGASLDECAAAVGFAGPTMVSRFLRLLELDDAVQHLVDWGASDSTVSFTAASELGRLPLGTEQAVAAEAVLEHRMRVGEVKQLIQSRLRSGKRIEDSVEVILRLRPRIERRHVFVGAIASQPLRQALERLRQAERDELLKGVLRRILPAGTHAAGRLGTDRFTIAGAEDLAMVFTADPDFEETVAATLAEALKQ